MSSVRFLLSATVLLCAILSSAQPHDTLSHALKEVDVKGNRARSFLRPMGGVSVVSMEMMGDMPRILGNADPVHYAQLLPGVQTNSEYDAGLHIQGCDNEHNQVGIDGVPLYNVAHLLGFFSVFNATHFSQMHLTKSPVTAASPNRLGGEVDMHRTDSVPLRRGSLFRRMSGDLSVGPMSSQGTLRMPVGDKSFLVVSGRAAYLNLLYSQWLKYDGEAVKYSFDDYNLTWLYRPDERNTVWLEGYYGHDNVKYDDAAYSLDASVRWSNGMAALHWLHEGRSLDLKQTLYYTDYHNRLNIDRTEIRGTMPSYIADVGYKIKGTADSFVFGADAIWHTIQPQNPEMNGLIRPADGIEERRDAFEGSLYGDRRLPLSRTVEASLGLRATVFMSDGTTFYAADPGLSLTWRPSSETLFTLYGGVKHQYLFNTGFSDKGLPSEFWLAADASRRPQYSYNTSLSFDTYLSDKSWRLSAEVYYKRLFHQVEYCSNVFDILYSEYNLDDMLLWGDGHNYGFNLLLERRKGRLTGWMSYSLGRAMRRFPGSRHTGWYPASHERTHEFNAVATYRLSPRWSFGATFVAASGTPYTRPKQFYVLNGNIMTEYGEYNAARVEPYVRLDLSVNYDFRTKNGRRSGLNLSLYNATAHSNVLFYRLKVYENQFALRPFSFVMPILPSINYYYSF